MTREVKALAYAALAAILSVGGTGLISTAIKMTSDSSPSPVLAAESSSRVANTPENIDQGHQYYEMSCSHCHGDDASGDDDGPDLHDLRISNAHIAITIKKGIKGQMPTFAKKYDDRQIAILVSYLRSLR